MNHFKIILFILILITTKGINAQPFFDVLSVSNTYSFPVKSAEKNKKEIRSSYTCADLSIPIKLKEDVLVFSPGYENYFLSFQDSTPSASVQGFRLPVAFVHKWKKSLWKTTFLVIGRSNAYVKENWKDDSYQLGGAAIMAYEKKKNLTYKFGLYYNSEFFGPFFVPLLGIDYRPSDRVKIYGILPGSMNVEYKFSSILRGGALFRSITGSYRGEPHQFLKNSDNQLRLFLDFYLTKNHVISLEAGHTIMRRIKPGQRINGYTTYPEFKTTDGTLFRIAYAFRIRLDQDEQKK